MLLATLCGMVLPAVAAIAAVKLLGPPDVPHTSRLAVLAAAALTLAEAIFAGLGAGALVEAAWRGVHLPGSGPVDYLPLRWVRRRAARRYLIALSQGTDVGRIAHRRRARRISELCSAVGRRLGLSEMDCERACIAAVAYRDVDEISSAGATPGVAWAGAGPPNDRLAAVVEAYDALTSGRRDHPGLAREEAFGDLQAMSLDPDAVEALIEVETEKGVRFASVPLLGGLLVALSGLLRRGRHLAHTSATPAAAGATVLAIVGAGLFGYLPALQGASVLALRLTGPSVVVQATPTPTAPAAPTGGPSAQPSSPSSRLSRSPSGTGTGPALRAPLYFPSAVPHQVLVSPLPGVFPSTSPMVTSQPAASQSPAVIYVTQFPGPTPSATSTPTPAPTDSTPPAQIGPVADKIVSTDQMAAALTLSSPPLSTTSPNELILAFISGDGPTTGAQSVSSVSGGGLTWSLAARANTQLGTAEVWQAYAATPLANVTVAATLASKGHGSSMTIATFTGAASAVGATAVGGAAAGAAVVALTTTRGGSLLWAVGHDGSQAVTPTPLVGQNIVHQFLDRAAGHASWVQTAGRISAANSVVTLGDSAPILDRWDLVAVEIPALG
jgi:hypothetical protein